MYHFLAQTLIGLGEPRGRGFESLLQPETFSCLCETGRVPLQLFFENLVSKRPPFIFFDVLRQTFFGTMRLFQNCYFSSEISQYTPTNNFFSILSQILT